MSLGSRVANLFSGSTNSQRDRESFGIVDDGLPNVKLGTQGFGSDTMASQTDQEEGRPPYLHSMIAGGLGGTTGDLLMHSLDTVKTRQQGDPHIPPRYTSMSSSYGTILRQEGLRRGLYGGWLPALLGSFPGTVIFFGTYEYSKRHMIDAGITPQFAYLTSGFLADFAASFVYVPSEVLKTRLQLQGRYNNPFFQSGYNYKSTSHAARTIIRQEGFFALFYGYKATIFRDLPFSALQFAFYEQGQTWARQWKRSRDIGLPLELLTGAAAGGLAGVITCPLDVVKTRIQTQVNPAARTTPHKPLHNHPITGKTDTSSSLKQQIRSISTSSPSTHTPRPGSIKLDTSSVFTGLKVIYRTEGFAGGNGNTIPSMPASLPVPSKGALRALRNLALGTSCTVAISAGLLTEDRRRRINTAREVHNNAKKLKSARQYHSTGGSTIETFEEQALKYRDDAFWLPSNVLQDTNVTLHDDGRGIVRTRRIGQEIFKPEDVPRPSSSLPPGILREKLPSVKKIIGFNRIPVIPARDPVPKASVGAKPELWSRRSQLALEVATFLDGNPPDIEAAASIFFEAFDSPLTTEEFGLSPEIIESARRLSVACRNGNRHDLSDKVFDIVLVHGPITEQQFASFIPESVISRLLARDAGCDRLHPTNLKKASFIYLTRFMEKPKTMSDGMLSLGDQLCLEAARSQMDDLVLQLYNRMESTRGGRPARSVHHLVIAAHRKGLHHRGFRYFQNFYTQTSPDQVQFYEVCSVVIDSLLKLQRLDLAEQALVSATRMAESQSLVTSTTWILKVLGHDWRLHHDIDRTRALFDRLEPLSSITQHPQAIYACIIRYCIKARKEATAELYYDKLRQSYDVKSDSSIHGHFALAKAYREDWPGVFEEFLQVQQASPSDVELLGRCFTPILHEYAKTHSLTEVEDYISLFADSFGLKINVQLMNFMVAAYGKSKEVECMVRWIDCAVAEGCAVNAATVNIILGNCHYLWGFSFEQVYQLFLLIQKKAGDSTTLLNSKSVAFLRQIAVTTTRDPARLMKRLKRFDKHSGDSDGIYRSMATAFANMDLAATLRIYKRAQSNNAVLEYRHLRIAVKASLRFHEDSVKETVKFIKEAQQRGIHVRSAISAVFIHQVTKLFDDGISVAHLVDLCHSTITAFEKSGTQVPLDVVTHTASCLHRRGFDGAAIDLWNVMSSRLQIPPSSFDLASITTLLNAYIGLQDHAGVRWVIHMLSANKLRPDKQFKLLLNNARRTTTRMIESQPCSNQVHEFLDSILEALQRIKVMREDALVEQTQVRTKTIMIIEKAINDQNARNERKLQSVADPQRVKQVAGTEMASPDSIDDIEPKAFMSDEGEMIHNVDIQIA
ncbi:hypothetical protein EG329_003858 [Mollisiaceae sp. DMI_Dod_QoI]|nr:hypothetical protein EG329_003858 [Helotiales sp. DMI_Dod_QoI]